MALYLVQLVGLCGMTLKGGFDTMIIDAASEAQAKEAAAAKFDGDGSVWSGATVTALAVGDWEGWTFEIDILGGFGVGGAFPASVSVVGTSTNDTIDEIAALLVTALNALDGIAGAAYNATTQTLTIAETTDGLGDQKVQVRIIPPNGYSSIASLVGTLTDEGASGDALTVVLPSDAATPPTVFVTAKS